MLHLTTFGSRREASVRFLRGQIDLGAIETQAARQSDQPLYDVLTSLKRYIVAESEEWPAEEK